MLAVVGAPLPQTQSLPLPLGAIAGFLQSGEPLSCRVGWGTLPQEACQPLAPSPLVKFTCKNNVSALFRADRNPTDNWEERKMQTLESAVSWVHFPDCLMNAPSTDRCFTINT